MSENNILFIAVFASWILRGSVLHFDVSGQIIFSCESCFTELYVYMHHKKHVRTKPHARRTYI